MRGPFVLSRRCLARYVAAILSRQPQALLKLVAMSLDTPRLLNSGGDLAQDFTYILLIPID